MCQRLKYVEFCTQISEVRTLYRASNRAGPCNKSYTKAKIETVSEKNHDYKVYLSIKAAVKSQNKPSWSLQKKISVHYLCEWQRLAIEQLTWENGACIIWHGGNGVSHISYLK